MAEQTTPPSRQEVIDFLKESIELAQYRSELQKLNTQIAVDRSEELKALVFIGQVTNPKSQDLENHIVTQEDIDNNPELTENGINPGDEIQIPVDVKRKLKRETTK